MYKKREFEYYLTFILSDAPERLKENVELVEEGTSF